MWALSILIIKICPFPKGYIWFYNTLFSSITKTRLFKYIENFIPKNWKFSDKNSHIFHISAQNIDCGYSLEPPRRGGSNEYPQSMLLSRNMKNNVYPCKPQFYYIKVGFKGSKLYRRVFVMIQKLYHLSKQWRTTLCGILSGSALFDYVH